ncbi:MAG: SH3 domain-containing protein [Cyanobacteria bacterium P01_F01_bin.150]
MADESDLSSREIAIKEREVAIKEYESKAKLELEKKGVLLSSPLLIAIVSTVFGTAIGAALQGNSNLSLEKQKFESNFQLERQKFEFSLIQRALEEEDREEAVKQLLFLVDSGVIEGLEAGKIRSIAETPEQLPTITVPRSTGKSDRTGSIATVVGIASTEKNVRSGQGTDKEVLFTVPNGQQVLILRAERDSSSYLWYKIALPSDNGEFSPESTGWIASHLLDFNDSSTGSR